MTIPCGAIILAAGQSRRMGSNKLLAPFRGKPMVTHVADAVQAAGLPAIVVLGHTEQEVRAVLAPYRPGFVFAADHDKGMGHSIAAGIAAVPAEWQAVLICLGDMPLITPELLSQMAGIASPSSILIPTFEGQRGNPVLWGRDHFASLTRLQGDVGARMIFQQLATHILQISWPDDSILRDFDTPDTLDGL
jgi:molybdenum cofactor cytidylyltransferase